MCSRSSPTELDSSTQKINLVTGVCRKCTSKASVVIQSKFSYCRECFLEYFKHKFRATLGKSKIMKHGDKILIGFSGSASSLCLIDLLNDSMSDGKKKKMALEVNAVFINESAAYNEDDIKLPNLNEISDILEPYNIKVHSTDLGAFVVNDLNLEANNLYDDLNRVKEIRHLFLKFQTLTSKADLLIKIRNSILFSVAHKLGCQKIFTAETRDHLAINTISNIAQGRGGQLSDDIGFSNDRSPDVTLVRPLQDCSKKEVAFYNIFNNLNPISSTTFSTKGDKYSSIQKLSESFINELQNSFPSTVLTIHATGRKLTTLNDEELSYCCLCQGKVDKNKLLVTAHQATQVSRLVSNFGHFRPPGFDSATLTSLKNPNESGCASSCSRNDCECLNSVDENYLAKSIENSLCYGCQLIFKDCESVESLPKDFLARLQEQSQLNKMHEEIKTFLL